MKLTLFLSILTISQLWATETYSQMTKLTLKLEDVKISDALKEIENQSEFYFLYSPKLIDVERKVNIDAEKETIKDILSNIFDEKVEFIVYDKQIILIASDVMSLSKALQQLKITGTVTDKNGPIPGVNVVVTGTTQGAITDIAGKYSIEVPPGSKSLTFSFVGMESQEITIGTLTQINVTMAESAIGLEEVIVVGYGAQKKRDVTGSIATANMKTLQNYAVVGPGQALQGKLAGVQISQSSGDPRAGVSIRIRGVGTFGANSAPLIVIDGIITDQGLTDINNNSVENIIILKDASAAAIYGSRGANGVVLITTKRGNAEQQQIQFSSYYSFDDVWRINTPVNSVTYANMMNEYFVNSGKAAPFTDDEIASYTKSTNWQREIFRTGGKQNYELLTSGGTNKNLYSISAGYYKGNGVVVNHTFDRYNLRVNNDITPFGGLKIVTSIGLSYGTVKQGNPNGAISAAMRYPPMVPAYLPNGNFGIADHIGEPVSMGGPLIQAFMPQNKSIFSRALLSTSAEYEIIKGLKFKSSVGIEYNSTNVTNFNPTYDYGTANKNLTASLTRQFNDGKNLQWDNIITYNKTINQKHIFDVLAGWTFQTLRGENFSGYREGFLNNDISQQVLSSGLKSDQARGSYSIWAMQSYLGRLNYSYMSKYLFTGNLRIDESSRFPKTNRTGIFPSFSFGWVLSEENFMKDILRPVSFLKLRMSYGFIGNQDIGVYPYQNSLMSNLYYSFGTGQTVSVGTSSTSNVNPNITWERTATSNIGSEVRLFNDKLSFIVDYYNRITSDVLVSVSLPSLSGRSGKPYQNIGSVRNRGFEFTLGYGNMNEKKDFTYEVGFNLSTNRNEVIKLSSETTLITQGSAQSLWEYRTEQGHEINEYYGYVMVGLFQTPEEIANWAYQPNAAPGDMKFADLNNDGVINSLDRKYIGSSLTQEMIGFNASAKYKNFDLSMSLNGEFGRSMYILTNGYNLVRMGEITSAMYNDRWTAPGTSNYVPRLCAGDPNNNARMSTFWLRSQNYVRIQNVQLGYTIPSKLTSKIKIQNLKFYFAVENLYTFDSFPGFDPELGTDTYPIPRSVYFGINMSF